MATQANDNHEEKIVVIVDEDLQDLIPGYLENRLKDITAIRESIAQGDYEAIRSIGHKMKGSGGGYGFDEITNIGREIEESAKIEHREEIIRQMEALKTYLERLEVVYQA
ncbi:MAG: Hpt domain-containing protein [Syntrophales bacterium]|jgi:HPt (histidine-containing phosphotransfer) domain-containing protein